MSKKCALLNNHVRLSPDGTVQPCCVSDWELPEDYPPLPRIEDGIEAAFDSEFFNFIRDKMDRGEEPETCSICYDEEKYGAKSFRQEWNEKYDVNSPKKIRYIHTWLTNHCNLACRMCNETYSTKWFQLKNLKQKVNKSEEGSIIDYYDGDLSEVDRIRFSGGEPLIDKHHVPFLEHLMKEKNNDISNVKLEYNTNGTVKPTQRVIEFWKQAESVLIEFSIDGIGKVNEILRPPHSWDTVLETIAYFKSIEGVNFTFDMHTVINIANIKYMEETIQFSYENFGKLPILVVLRLPEHLSIYNQTPEMKSYIHNMISEKFLGQIDETGTDNSITFLLDKLKEPNDTVYTIEEVIAEEDKHHYFKNSISELL